MSATQSIIENIRNLVANYGATGDEPMEWLAESYAATCNEVNARLLRCSQLIRGGNLSEAVRLAEIEPVLLETFAALNFPERMQWAEITRSHQLPVAVPLLEELAREVADAFATVNPLQPLLKQHRLLALGRAPLARRMAVLREIVSMEPDNPGWKADLDTYEQIRLRTLEKEIAGAIAAKDVSLMSELVAELDSQNWSTPPSEKLIAALRRTLQAESQRVSFAELKQTVEKLTQAVQAKNANLGIKLADRWYAQTKRIGENMPMELEVTVRTPLLWIEEQRRIRDRAQSFEEWLEDFRNTLQSAPQTGLN